ncbi:unnamed protein product [Rotaria magnacalcarata]|uniref:Citrate transporter-like domain-containing protein n=1 Tax=Rotaria magnacalcarata TaxID=392030 RepID=A0A816MMG2_9BILA|nr:unnamed protein product [Rotaria magnacalcarata]
MTFGYSVEKVNLHRPIALFVLSWVGIATKWTVTGMMGSTAFLSMWMNNTAPTSIMLPVALAVVHELGIYSENSLNRQQAAVINVVFDSQMEKDPTKIKLKNSLILLKDVKHRFLLAVAYSSSIGVLSSLVGTAPNVYLKGFVETHISDGTATIFCGILPLILPDSNPFSRNHDWKYEPIVKWTQLEQTVSWGSILLLGAGLTIATTFEKSKLSDSVGQILGFASDAPRAAASIHHNYC